MRWMVTPTKFPPLFCEFGVDSHGTERVCYEGEALWDNLDVEEEDYSENKYFCHLHALVMDTRD